ncbi:MAG: metallophosphoesterase [Planctomycetota bacterium]|jgi:3',5'-cyclic AMP phosphodiesterase CpdA
MAGKMWNRPFFFIQMSDQQFGMLPVNGDVFHETQLSEKAVAHVNRLSPAFVVNTGDLVDKPGDEKQLTEVLRTTRKLDKSIPLYTVPGNHDIADAPTEQSLGWYRKRIGKDWYSFDYGGWHFIGLNSCIIAHGQNMPREAEKQWGWLNQDLERTVSTGNSHIIVFMHHPLFLSDPEEADDYFNVPRQVRQAYLNLFREYGVKTVLAGHLHQNNLATDSRLEVVTTGPVGMPLGCEPPGFRIVRVYADHIEHRYFGLDDVISLEF